VTGILLDSESDCLDWAKSRAKNDGCGKAKAAVSVPEWDPDAGCVEHNYSASCDEPDDADYDSSAWESIV
jgi:hypothetical protein